MVAATISIHPSTLRLPGTTRCFSWLTPVRPSLCSSSSTHQTSSPRAAVTWGKILSRWGRLCSFRLSRAPSKHCSPLWSSHFILTFLLILPELDFNQTDTNHHTIAKLVWTRHYQPSHHVLTTALLLKQILFCFSFFHITSLPTTPSDYTFFSAPTPLSLSNPHTTSHPQHHTDSSIGVFIIDRYTYHVLEFLELVTSNSNHTIGQLVSSVVVVIVAFCGCFCCCLLFSSFFSFFHFYVLFFSVVFSSVRW